MFVDGPLSPPPHSLVKIRPNLKVKAAKMPKLSFSAVAPSVLGYFEYRSRYVLVVVTVFYYLDAGES